MTQKTLYDSGLVKRETDEAEKIVKPLWTGGVLEVVTDEKRTE